MISFCKKFTWIEWKGPPHVSAAALFGLQTQTHKRQRDNRKQGRYEDHACSVVAVGVLGLGNHGDGCRIKKIYLTKHQTSITIIIKHFEYQTI